MSHTTGTERRKWLLAAQLLHGFDMDDGPSREFLESLVATGNVPQDALAELTALSLARGAEEWDMMLCCATSMRDRLGHVGPADPGLVLACLRWVMDRPPRQRQRQRQPPRSGRGKKKIKAESRFRTGDWEASHDRPGLRTTRRESGKSQAQSPFFAPSSPTTTTTTSTTTTTTTRHLGPPAPPRPKRGRPPAGTVSSLPVPPLSAARFGLLQEECAHDPFWLLVAVRFLVKTTGRAAIPAFRALKARFPTPEALAAAEAEAEVIPMIRHLGLSAVRCATIQKYARAWVARPPGPAVRFAVKNYPRPGDGGAVRAGEEFGPEAAPGADAAGTEQSRRARGCAWEIGHMTQGRYTIDSWRIFCRDVMLGRAEDWTGTGAAHAGFQPEWMRVLPEDKELRACLRWMWMREGWLWDAVTGEKEVLPEDMRQAVGEGRLGYDDTGSLVIMQHPLVLGGAV